MQRVKFLIIGLVLFSIGITGCGFKQSKNDVVTQSYTNAAHKRMVWETTKTVYDNQVYRYDSEIDNDGERWNTKIYEEILKRDQNKALPYVKGDCEDTMFANARILDIKGFPKDQMYLVYCLVPADQAGNQGGHAILVVLIDGMFPYAVEQLPEPRPLQDLIINQGYEIVAFVRYDEDLLSGWNFAVDGFVERSGWIFKREDWIR